MNEKEIEMWLGCFKKLKEREVEALEVQSEAILEIREMLALLTSEKRTEEK